MTVQVPQQFNPTHPLIPDTQLATSAYPDMDLWIHYLMHGRDRDVCLITKRSDKEAMLRQVMTVDQLPEKGVYACHFYVGIIPRFTVEVNTHGSKEHAGQLMINRILQNDLPDDVIEKFKFIWSRAFKKVPPVADRVESTLRHAFGEKIPPFQMGTDGCKLGDFEYKGRDPFAGIRLVLIAYLDQVAIPQGGL